MGRTKKKGKTGKADPVGLPAEMEDEVDIFHKGRDKVGLNTNEEALGDSLSEDDIDVYNLGGSESEDSDDESDGRIADRGFLLSIRLVFSTNFAGKNSVNLLRTIQMACKPFLTDKQDSRNRLQAAMACKSADIFTCLETYKCPHRDIQPPKVCAYKS